jgi:hypothetical protein
MSITMDVNLNKNRRQRAGLAEFAIAAWLGDGYQRAATNEPGFDGFLRFVNGQIIDGILSIKSKLDGKPQDGKITAFQTPARRELKEQAQRMGKLPYFALVYRERTGDDDIRLVIFPLEELETLKYVTHSGVEKTFRHSLPWNGENLRRLERLPGAVVQRVPDGARYFIDKSSNLR